MRHQTARTQWHLSQITGEIEPIERGRHVLGARRKSERETKKPRCAKPSAPKRSRRRMEPILHWRKSKADAQTSLSAWPPLLGARIFDLAGQVTRSFVARHIPYTCIAPGPPLDLLRHDLTLRIFRIWPLYASCTA